MCSVCYVCELDYTCTMCIFTHLCDVVLENGVGTGSGTRLWQQVHQKQSHVAHKLHTECGETKHIINGALHKPGTMSVSFDVQMGMHKLVHGSI